MKAPRSGFSLIEVTLSLAVMSFSLVIMLGLLPVGLQTVRSSSQISMTSNLLSAVSADVQAVPVGETQSPVYDIPVWDANASSAQIFLDDQGNRVSTDNFNYIVSWKINRPEAGSTAPLLVYLRIDPARVNSEAATSRKSDGSVETLIAMQQR